VPPVAARGAPRGRPLTAGGAVPGDGFRCAPAGEERGESLAGTASTFRGFLLVEHAGAWGVEALHDARLPDGVGPALKSACAAAGVKPLLMRRPGRSRPEGCRVFAAFTGYADRPAYLETAVLDRPDDVLGLDLAALRAGHILGLTRHDRPVFGVCTHGRHDACCAERGRPVAAALAAAHPEETWELSHLGGDRFAANLVIFPHGLYYGRLDADSGPAVAGAHLRGEVDLDHLRGRSSYAPAVQYAEIALRRELGVLGLHDVRLTGRAVVGEETRVAFRMGSSSYAVVVRSVRGPAVRLTCRARRAEPALVHELLGFAEAEASPDPG